LQLGEKFVGGWGESLGGGLCEGAMPIRVLMRWHPAAQWHCQKGPSGSEDPYDFHSHPGSKNTEQ